MEVIATIIAFLVFCVAVGQWATARSKLVLDLFDKRFSVYTDLHEPVREALRTGAVTTPLFVEFALIANRAQFLFGRDVQACLRDAQHTLNRLGEATSMLEGGRLPPDENERHLRQRRECMGQLAPFSERITALMLPYMQMDQKLSWDVVRRIVGR